MIDLQEIIEAIHSPLKKYTGVPQLVQGNTNIPPRQLVYPRIVYHFMLPYNADPGQMIILREEVESQNPNFEKDIQYTYIEHPTATMSLVGYGEPGGNIEQQISKARDWFRIPELGRNFLKWNYGVVVRRVENITDITTAMETGFQRRWAFDVILRFQDRVVVTLETIESVEYDITIER